MVRDYLKKCNSHLTLCFSVAVQQVHNILIEFRQTMTFAETRFTYFQAPVLVEDALGRRFPLPSEFSLSDLECLLCNKFREGPGTTLVENGLYDLVNARNNTQVITEGTSGGLLPGTHVIMAMLLQEQQVVPGRCPIPRCTSNSITTVLGGGFKRLVPNSQVWDRCTDTKS